MLPFIATGVLGGRWTVRSWRAIRNSKELGVEGLIGYQREHMKAKKNVALAWDEFRKQQKTYQEVTDDRRLLYSGLDGFDKPKDRYPVYVVRYKDYKAVSIAHKKLKKAQETYGFFRTQKREASEFLAQATRVRKLELQQLSKGELQQELARYRDNLSSTKVNFIQADKNGRPRYLTLTVAEAEQQIDHNLVAYKDLQEKINTGDKKAQRQFAILQANVEFDAKDNKKEIERAKAIVKELEDMLADRGDESLPNTSKLENIELSMQRKHEDIAATNHHLEKLQSEVYRNKLKIHNSQEEMPELLAGIDEKETRIEELKDIRMLRHMELQKDVREKERLQDMGRQVSPSQARKRIEEIESKYPNLITNLHRAEDEAAQLDNSWISDTDKGRQLLFQLGEIDAGIDRRKNDLLRQVKEMKDEIRQKRRRTWDEFVQLTAISEELKREKSIIDKVGGVEQLEKARRELVDMEKERRVLPRTGRGVATLIGTSLTLTVWKILAAIDQSIWGYGDRQLGRYWFQVFLKSGDFTAAERVHEIRPILIAVADTFDYQVNPDALLLID